MLTVRKAVPDDASALLAIYGYYVKNTAVSFEYEVPSPEEFRRRICNTLAEYPYIVAEIDGKPVGYAYAGCFKNRIAYDLSVELTVYVDKNMRRCGVGSTLYRKLEELLVAQNITNAYACIAVPLTDDDPYLTNASVLFHYRMGYDKCGEFRKCGNKFGRWYDMVWMEKILNKHTQPPARRMPFSLSADDV